MENLILAIRLGLRRAWRSFLDFLSSNRLDALPPARTAILILAVGVLVPLAAGVNTQPAAVTTSLARERLTLFLKKLPDPPPSVSPVSPRGEVHAARPAFHWPAVEGAARYKFRLHLGDTLIIGTDTVDAPRFAMPAPGHLEAGKTYRFRAVAVAGDGRELGSAGDTFTVQSPSEALVELRRQTREEVEPAAAALVLAGYYADQGWAMDVASALEGYLRLAPEGDSSELAHTVLSRLGYR